jgi:aldehyde dehydrogenase (NAD+)
MSPAHSAAKQTGGGRESRLGQAGALTCARQTNTINYGSDLPLAQGIRFDVGP